MTRTDYRKRLILIAICVCISLIIPVSQRISSMRIQKSIDIQRSIVLGLCEEKTTLQAEIAKMSTVETIMALGDDINVKFAQIPGNSTMIASN